ncbi:MAG: phenylalanine--tRNA ligase subunit beta [Candidatus Marinimicrobia bacterium]|nr:phenylalanine--tRNA ligase subunit beta [Candidatus Neomarinimicrobiota bacterium]
MKVSLSWLQQYIKIEDKPEILAEKLTLAGLEATVNIVGGSVPDKVVIGQVLSVEKHPNADKLSVCKVNVGDNEELTIVCGASNVAADQKVPVALVGSKLAPDFKIKKTKLRGIESHGMICAEDELGLGNMHEGIMVLDDGYEIGKNYNDYLEKEIIFDIDLTPNRPDCMSHFGVVREIAAITNSKYQFDKININESGNKIEDLTKINIENNEACPRYTARIIQNVEVKKSPKWLKERVESVGLRSINNIVDASNYVMMETGNPLHTFDFDKLSGHEINVRFAKSGEQFETIDHIKRKLSSEMLLICDSEKPIALAGIMGGLFSEVDENTKNVLIEAAYFNPAIIRKGSKLQQLSTDSSKRFERGIDPNDTLIYSQNRLSELINEVAGGQIAKGMIDIYPKKIDEKIVKLRFSKIKNITGLQIEKQEIKRIFIALGFEITEFSDDNISVKVPTFRPDIEREIDLVEEVIRVNSMDKIPTLKKINISVSENVDKLHPFLKSIRNLFVGMGFNETLSNSLVSEKMAKSGIWNYKPLKIQNPLSKEMNTLRTDIIQSLLVDLKVNAVRKRENIRLFEIGKTIEKESRSETGAKEHLNLGVLVAGPVWGLNWNEKLKPVNVYYFKGIFNLIREKYGIDNVKYKETKNCENNSESVSIYIRKREIGRIIKYEISKFDKLQLDYPVIVMEINLDTIFKKRNQIQKYREISLYPSIMRDISVVIDKTKMAKDLLDEIKTNGGGNLIDVIIYDRFIDHEKLGKDKISLSFRLEFRSKERTLKDNEIDKIMEKIFNKLLTNYGAQLR